MLLARHDQDLDYATERFPMPADVPTHMNMYTLKIDNVAGKTNNEREL